MTKRAPSPASLLLSLAALLGCSSPVTGATGGSTTAGGTDGPTTTPTDTTSGATVDDCVHPLLDCQYGGDACGCTASCPTRMIEITCTSMDGGTQQCDCILDGDSVGMCTGSFPYGPYDSYYGCGGQAGLGCCNTLLP